MSSYKTNKQHIAITLKKSWNNQPQLVITILAVLLISVWLGVILPTAEKNKQYQASLVSSLEELSAMQNWAEKIQSIQASLTENQKVEVKESLLQQVERIGKETKVFNKISRISPSKVRLNGRDYEGISLEFEKTSMAEISPFLNDISYKSILNIHEITIQRIANESGMISIRMVLVSN